MTHLNKLKVPSHCKWVSSNLNNIYTIPPKTTSPFSVFQTLRFYGNKSSSLVERDPKFAAKMAQGVRRKAQEALRDYFHLTRGLEYMDADFISHNSPLFLDNLLKMVESDSKIELSMSRFLCYNPVNEYEPFFESMGLKPTEYASFLPRHLMYLNDDAKLLENYQVLSNYGIGRSKIGRVYTEANEVFKYDYGVLLSKLYAFEKLGLDRNSVIKVVSSNPRVLVGDTNMQFCKVLEKLKELGTDCINIEQYLIHYDSYKWSHLLELLYFLRDVFGSNAALQKLVSRNPGILFDHSGIWTFSLIGHLLKLRYTKNDMCSMFSQIPQVEIKTFVINLRNCYQFLVELRMEAHEIGNIVRLHPLLLGSCSLKKLSSLLTSLRTGKIRLSNIIKENPQVLKDWIVGLRAEALPNLLGVEKSRMMKAQFLLDLGFVENSSEFEKTLKLLRGKGSELQERFDCFVKAGIDKKDVAELIKSSPRVLNQSKNMIEMKIDYLLKDMGYPLSALIGFPVYVNYSMERVKLRFSMFNWLKEQGRAKMDFTLSTILACSEKVFVKHFVDEHPGGPEVYQKLKKEINRY